jgi:hypothetical protein
VADAPAVHEWVASVERDFGLVNLIIPNAGITLLRPLLEVTVDELQHLLQVSLFGAFHLAQAGARRLVENKQTGRIVFTGSWAQRLKKLGVVREIRGKGVLRGVELVEDATTKRSFPPGRKLGPLLKRTAIENGLIMRIDPDWFAVCPALIAERSDVDEMVELVERSLKDALDLWVRQQP